MSHVARTRVPLSTYRLQLHAGFDFDAAVAVVPYLAALGIGAVYCSPYLEAAPGSTHGYDVVRHDRANPELGGEEGRARLVATLREHGLGQVLDIVPNHACVAPEASNPAWLDLLTHGQSSPQAALFDVDWEAGGGKVVLPLLEDEAALRAFRVVDDGHGGALLQSPDGGLSLPTAPGTAAPGDDPIAVHALQHYRLVGWREAPHTLNYRRFFDVTTLAALRVEDPEVFDATHATVLDWVARGELDGLRVDHPDGLADPTGYLQTLRARMGEQSWLVVEKILEPGERLPAAWPVDGTTGYDAMRLLTGVHVDPAGEAPLSALYSDLTGVTASPAELAREGKLAAATTLLLPEVTRATRALQHAGAESATVEGVAALMAALPVYRTYLCEGHASPHDVALLQAAADDVARHEPALAAAAAAAVQVLVEGTGSEAEEARTRFQQTSGMVMAKGVEDTSFYRHHRLAATAEVGADPQRFSVSLDEWHAECAELAAHHPLTMTALSTHDTKRSEDVRARLALLSQVSDRWSDTAHALMKTGEAHWSSGVPDRNLQYLLLQCAFGAWPISGERLGAYAEKASREAKQRTSWVDPDPTFDDALQSWVRTVVDDAAVRSLLDDLAADLLPDARTTSAAMRLLQLTMPGVPDVYQGCELESLALVDPDNRRPVDYARARGLLAELDTGLALSDCLARADEGLLKLAVTARGLRLRKDLPEVFLGGGYRPLSVQGDGDVAEAVVAFTRGADEVAVVSRRWHARRAAPGTVTLPAGDWREVLGDRSIRSDGSVALEDLLSPLPFALLRRG